MNSEAVEVKTTEEALVTRPQSREDVLAVLSKERDLSGADLSGLNLAGMKWV